MKNAKSKALEGVISRRTFEARKYPKGSPERAKLNESGRTSEYMSSHRYHKEGPNYSLSFRTRKEAENFGKKNK